MGVGLGAGKSGRERIGRRVASFLDMNQFHDVQSLSCIFLVHLRLYSSPYLCACERACVRGGVGVCG